MAIFTAFLAVTGLSSLAGAITIFGLSPGLSAAIIGIGKSLLWNVAAAALGPKPKVTPQEVQAVLSQATGPRIRGYGEFLVGGTRAFWEVKDGTLYQIIAAHHGEVNAIVGWYVDGQPVTFSAAGAASSGPAIGYLGVKSILSGDGGNYADVKSQFPAFWTDDHKLTGVATYLVTMNGPPLDRMSKIFPRQAQTTVQMAAELSKVFDPRVGFARYVDVTGPCVLDYLTHQDGYRIPMAAIDLDSFTQFTHLCAQNVDLKSGGTDKRYRVGGFYTLEDAPKDVMARLLATADAQVYMTAEGKVGILGGKWLDPDVTITSEDILEFAMSDGIDEFTDFNVLKGIFMSPDHRYQNIDAEEMRDDTALETQPERVESLSIDMCPAFPQMRRLMKAYWYASHREWTGTIKTNLVGLKARFPRGEGKHVIRLVIDELEIYQTFEVLGHSYSVADRTCDIIVASIENPYNWDPETEEGTPPPPLQDLIPITAAPLPPTGLTLSQEIIALSAGQNATRIVATVDDPGRDDLQLTVQYRPEGATEWTVMTGGVGDLRVISAAVSENLVYEVRAGWLGYVKTYSWSELLGVAVLDPNSGYSAIETITTVANPTAPAPASAFSISEAGGTVTLSWTNGATGYYRTRIYRGDSATFSGASIIATLAGLPGTPQTYDDSPGAGTWYYWVVIVNTSLIEAAPTGPESETI